jgi:hypothetical protein
VRSEPRGRKMRPITIIRDQAGTILYEEPLKDGRSTGDDGRPRNETSEYRNEAQDGG